jgi:hypothetical protein
MKVMALGVLVAAAAALGACNRGQDSSGGQGTTVVHDRTVVVPEREDRTVVIQQPVGRGEPERRFGPPPPPDRRDPDRRDPYPADRDHH